MNSACLASKKKASMETQGALVSMCEACSRCSALNVTGMSGSTMGTSSPLDTHELTKRMQNTLVHLFVDGTVVMRGARLNF